MVEPSGKAGRVETPLSKPWSRYARLTPLYSTNVVAGGLRASPVGVARIKTLTGPGKRCSMRVQIVRTINTLVSACAHGMVPHGPAGKRGEEA